MDVLRNGVGREGGRRRFRSRCGRRPRNWLDLTECARRRKCYWSTRSLSSSRTGKRTVSRCGSHRAIGIEALEVHGPVRPELVDGVHWLEDGGLLMWLQLQEVNPRVGDFAPTWIAVRSPAVNSRFDEPGTGTLWMWTVLPIRQPLCPACVSPHHSARSALTGSSRAARRAGT